MNQTINDLKKNAAFQMSLSGKELFHSNMIAMFLAQEEEEHPTALAKKIMEFFPPKGGIIENTDAQKSAEDTVVFDVLREKDNLDLIIIYCTKQEKDDLRELQITCADDIIYNSETSDELAKIIEKFKYVVVENKFKSFPYNEQLEEYTNKGLEIFQKPKRSKYNFEVFKAGNVQCYLFAPEESLNIFFDCEPGAENWKKEFTRTAKKKGETDETIIWQGKSYNELVSILKSCIEENPDDKSLIHKFIEEYSKFLETMLQLYKEEIIEKIINQGKCFLSAEQNNLFLKGRIQDFYEKILFNQLLNKLKKDYEKTTNYSVPFVCGEMLNQVQHDSVPFDYNFDGKDAFILARAEYSRQHGNIDFRPLWKDYNVNVGIQIQNNGFEILLCAELDLYEKKLSKEDFNKAKEQYNYQKVFDEFKAEVENYTDTIKIQKKQIESAYNSKHVKKADKIKESEELRPDFEADCNEIRKKEPDQMKWIRNIYNEIKKEYEKSKDKDAFPFPEENILRFKETEIKPDKFYAENEHQLKAVVEDMYGYTTDKYIFRYGYIDLNELAEGGDYRNLSYATLKSLVNAGLKIITDNKFRYKK